MLYKLGLKAEYRIYSENALLLSYTSYWQYYPGWQAALEYRIYFHTNTLTENLVYCKIGSGFADYERSDLYDTKTSLNRAPGTYYFGGGGVGRHWNYGVFFMELCAGLKFAYVTNPPALYNERIFYTLGPGSFPDVHFNFGIQL